MDGNAAPELRHDPQGQRFVADVDGFSGHLDYERDARSLIVTHTFVPPAIGGRGVAAALVRAAAELARASGLRLVPACSYAATWLRRHPEYADLQAGA
jgi:predicted GNAT family acetyltransferase